MQNVTMPLVHVAIALKGASWTDPSSIPLMVIQSILGSWNRSVGVGNCSGYVISFDSLHLMCEQFAFLSVLVPNLLLQTDVTY